MHFSAGVAGDMESNCFDPLWADGEISGDDENRLWCQGIIFEPAFINNAGSPVLTGNNSTPPPEL